jgi:putative ABC transport system ATP-binding protein
MSTILEVKNVEKDYGSHGSRTQALSGISFTVKTGQFVGIMGASGSGKTTLLNCIATIDSVTKGQILLEDRDITKLSNSDLAKFRRYNLGFIFQDFNLLDTLTAYENIALAITILNRPASEIEIEVRRVADRLDIGSILDKFPYQISGGQKQRVASARAIVTNPSLVLADEPTGALDSRSAARLLESFEQLVRHWQATILMVTHDAVAASYCDRIMFIRDGKLFHHLVRDHSHRADFFEDIIEVISQLGGADDVV